MQLWLGHYVGNRDAWFLCWGTTKAEAINYVDCETGEPDWDSLKPLRSPGMVDFKIHIEEGSVVVEENAHVVLDPEDQERIEETLKQPAKTPRLVEASHAASLLGITDPRVAATYVPSCPKCGKHHLGSCGILRT